MSAPEPVTPKLDCPICNGLGWYESLAYSEFGPLTQPAPCPDCNPVEPMTKGGCALLVFASALVIAALVWWLP